MSAKKRKTKKKTGKKKQSAPLFRRIAKWILVAGLWGFIGVGLLTAWYALELPGIVDSPHLERHSAITMLAGDGSVLTRYGELKGMAVDVKDLPPYLPEAVLAVEDRRFYDHFGIDPVGLVRAMGRNLLAGHVVQGGSTLTQQLAKNLFLSRDRTFKRKVQEALLALWLEHELTKDEILTAYLNRVYLGAGAYGVDAAAETYFNKSARDLNLYESAVLAGLLKAPSRYSPLNNPTLAAQRARTVLNAMRDAGYITEDEVKSQTLKAQAMMKKPTASGDGKAERYFTDWVISGLDDLIGSTDRNLTVETTLDPKIQTAAESALARILNENEKRHVTQGAIVVMDTNGAILAMVGGIDHGKSQFNRATQARRPSGSAFKPFVYLTALEKGWNPGDTILDAPITEGKYRPDNFGNEYMGEVDLTTALEHSLNTATVRLAQYVGISDVIGTARRLGIQADLSHDLSTALGSSGVPLIELVTAYAGIAHGGEAVDPYAIIKINNEQDELLYVRTGFAHGPRAVTPRSAAELAQMMTRVIEGGTGYNALLPFPAAGKTGTSQDFRDALFVGFTHDFVAGVWLGNDDNSPMKGITGGSLPAAIWREVMLTAHNTRQTQKSDGSNTAVDWDAPYNPAATNSNGFFSMIRSLLNE